LGQQTLDEKGKKKQIRVSDATGGCARPPKGGRRLECGAEFRESRKREYVLSKGGVWTTKDNWLKRKQGNKTAARGFEGTLPGRSDILR